MTIRNGVSLAQFQASPVDLSQIIPEDRKLILYVGRIDYQKGIDWLISIAPQFLSAHPNYDLALVGNGPSSLIRKLQRRISRADMAGRIRFLGWWKDVAPLLARADLLVLPSRYEGLPNAVLEAMAAGRAVLATRAEGVSEALGETAEKQTVRFGDNADFLAKIDALLTSPAAREELGAANLAR